MFHSLTPDICKFFGCELGAQTQMDAKNSRYIVNGSHEVARLQDLLDGFIKKFVLCPECENPETALVSHLCNTDVILTKMMMHKINIEGVFIN